MRIGNIQLVPGDDYDAEVFNFLHHQEPLDFSSSPPRGLFRPVTIPAMAPTSLDDYKFKPVQPQHVREERHESSKRRKSRRNVQKERKVNNREGDAKAGGDYWEKLKDKQRFDEVRKEIKETKEIYETDETKESIEKKDFELEHHIPEAILCRMCQKDLTDFTFPRHQMHSEVSSLSSWDSLSSLTNVSSLTDVSSWTTLSSMSSLSSLASVKPSVVMPKGKKRTSLFGRLRKFAKRFML